MPSPSLSHTLSPSSSHAPPISLAVAVARFRLTLLTPPSPRLLAPTSPAVTHARTTSPSPLACRSNITACAIVRVASSLLSSSSSLPPSPVSSPYSAIAQSLSLLLSSLLSPPPSLLNDGMTQLLSSLPSPSLLIDGTMHVIMHVVSPLPSPSLLSDHTTCSPVITCRWPVSSRLVVALALLPRSPPLTFVPLCHLHPPAALALVCKQGRERTTSRRTQVRRHYLPVTSALDSPPHPRAALTLPPHSRPIPSRLPARAHGHTCIGYGYGNGYDRSRISHV